MSSGYVAMELNLGGLETVVDPSLDDVRHYLKFMPMESPFVILSDGEHFIQSTYNGLQFQVEYRHDHGSQQYCCVTDYEKTCELFANFHSGRHDYRSAVEWKRLRPRTQWNTPGHPVVQVVACIIGLIGIGIVLWSAFN